MRKPALLLLIPTAIVNAGGCANDLHINVHVVDSESGLPIHGAELEAQLLIFRYISLYATQGPHLQTGTTDANGDIEFEFSTHNPYKVTTKRDGYHFDELIFGEIRCEIEHKTLVIEGRSVENTSLTSE